MSETKLYEGQDAVFESVVEHLDSNRHRVVIRQLSGPPRSLEEWERAAEQFRKVIEENGGKLL